LSTIRELVAIRAVFFDAYGACTAEAILDECFALDATVGASSLLNSRQLKFCLSAVGIFGFLAFESSREALKDRSEDEVRHTD
jgi:hypothetical protein